MTQETRRTKFIRVLFLLIGLALVGLVCAVCVYFVWEKAPEGSLDSGDRQKGVYTLLLVGIDEYNYATDKIFISKVDTENHVLCSVSVPGNTLINQDWQVRRLDTVYFSAMQRYKDPMSSLMAQVTRICGFQPDSYVLAPARAFEDGQMTSSLVLNIIAAAKETNLSQSNIAFLTRHIMACGDSSCFMNPMPTESAELYGYSYEVILLTPWIQLINAGLNPTDEPIGEEDLDIVYHWGEEFLATKELAGGWYFSGTYDIVKEEFNKEAEENE